MNYEVGKVYPFIWIKTVSRQYGISAMMPPNDKLTAAEIHDLKMIMVNEEAAVGEDEQTGRQYVIRRGELAMNVATLTGNSNSQFKLIS